MPIKFDTILARLRQKDITPAILAILNIWQRVGTLISPKTANDTLEVKSTTAGSIAGNFEGEFVGVHGVGTGPDGFGVVGYGNQTGVIGANSSTDPTACKPAFTARTNSANISKADIVAGFGTLFRWMLAWKGWTDPELSEKEAGNIAVEWSDPTIGNETAKMKFWLRTGDQVIKVAEMNANSFIHKNNAIFTGANFTGTNQQFTLPAGFYIENQIIFNNGVSDSTVIIGLTQNGTEILNNEVIAAASKQIYNNQVLGDPANPTTIYITADQPVSIYMVIKPFLSL